MNRNHFLADTDVTDFISWLANNLPNMQICLQIGKSRFVPTLINVRINGFGGVISHYKWKSKNMTVGDWAETKTRLTGLSNALRTAVNMRNESLTLNACDDILDWGGDRNRAVGAYPFLSAKAAANDLCNYIVGAGNAFLLANADEAILSPRVGLMNAMLTKVHALYATDGLPIYDSRVAAAIASLVELWRQATFKSGNNLPPTLTFPATLTTRTVLRLFPHASHPGVMTYGATTTPAMWSSAKIRLGWIMEKVLTISPDLILPSSHASLADRMHAFEASLFIIGYDVTCLDCKNSGKVETDYKKQFKLLNATMPHGTDVTKSINPLFKQGTGISYIGDLSSGFNVQWGSRKLIFEPEFLQDILNNFEGQKAVPLGASMTGVVPPNSLGQWIVDNGWPSRRDATAIAAILCNEKVLSKSNQRYCLDFY